MEASRTHGLSTLLGVRHDGPRPRPRPRLATGTRLLARCHGHAEEPQLCRTPPAPHRHRLFPRSSVAVAHVRSVRPRLSRTAGHVRTGLEGERKPAAVLQCDGGVQRQVRERPSLLLVQPGVLHRLPDVRQRERTAPNRSVRPREEANPHGRQVLVREPRRGPVQRPRHLSAQPVARAGLCTRRGRLVRTSAQLSLSFSHTVRLLHKCSLR